MESRNKSWARARRFDRDQVYQICLRHTESVPGILRPTPVRHLPSRAKHMRLKGVLCSSGRFKGGYRTWTAKKLGYGRSAQFWFLLSCFFAGAGLGPVLNLAGRIPCRKQRRRLLQRAASSGKNGDGVLVSNFRKDAAEEPQRLKPTSRAVWLSQRWTASTCLLASDAGVSLRQF